MMKLNSANSFVTINWRCNNVYIPLVLAPIVPDCESNWPKNSQTEAGRGIVRVLDGTVSCGLTMRRVPCRPLGRASLLVLTHAEIEIK
jgi:hypothetical protein